MPNDPPSHIKDLGDDYVFLWRELSAFPTREEVSEKIRLFKPRTLANLDCLGCGPQGRMLVRGKVCYPRDQIVIWFASMAKKQKSNLGGKQPWDTL